MLSTSVASGSSPPGYRPDLDGLRAVAVLSVLGFHGFPGYVRGGFFGVDVFFVLSGYLITSLILAEGSRGHFDIRAFYARRIRRLFPAALTVLAAACAAGYILLFSHEFDRLVRHAWASLFFVENLLLANEIGYFDVEAAKKPLLHFWSLAVEEQFYLIWPLALIPLMRRPHATATLITVVLTASFVLALSGALTPIWQFYSPLVRAWELAAGAALAWHLLRAAGLPFAGEPVTAGVVSSVAMAAVIVPMVVGPLGHIHPGWITLLPVLGTVTVIAVGPHAFANARILSLRPVVWVGLISYPLYLWHWPLLSYALIVTGERGSTWLRLILLALSVALAAATWRWIERPFRFTLSAQRSVAILISASLALAVGLFVLLTLRPAQTDLVSSVAEEQLEGVAWRHTANDLCRARHRRHFTAFCMQQGDADPDVLFVGNSYANHHFPGIAQHPALRSVPMLAFGNCEISRSFPIGIFGKDQCDAQLDMLRRYTSVKLVIVANQWSLFDRDGRMTDLSAEDPGKPADYPDSEGYRHALRQTFAEIDARGVPVIVVGPKPELGYDMADCYGRPFRPATRDCRVDRAEYDRKSSITTGILKGLVAELANLHYFDLAPLFCKASTCNFRAPDGTPYLRDDNGHFSDAGSRYVGVEIVRWAKANGIALPTDAASANSALDSRGAPR